MDHSAYARLKACALALGFWTLIALASAHGQWGKPMDLGDIVNKDMPWGSHLAPDGQTVYFTGQSGIWQLSLQPWLRRHAG